MPSAKKKIPLIVILGPTGVGKTGVAIELASRLNGEIVSADSRLLYRGMDIGTAKPSSDERNKIHHHLIDVADPDERWSLAQYQEAAKEAIEDIHKRGKLAFLVGGSGQYIRAIAHGWMPPALAPNPELRQVLEEWAGEIGREALHEGLRVIDPEAADKIDARNLRRSIRALEVIFSTGRRFSSQKGKSDPAYEMLQIGLIRDRQQLYQRIDARIQTMLEAGWLGEVKQLLDDGYGPELASMSAIGYAQLVRHIRGEIEMEEAIIEIKRASRIFVRRQTNWFKPDDPDIHWFDISQENTPDLIAAAIEFQMQEV